MKRHPSLAVAFLLGMACVCSAAETVSGKVVRVVRGDTLVVTLDGKEETIVLAGLASPSKVARLADKAKELLASKVAEREVTIQKLGRDADNKETAAVWRDGRSINAEMLREGWAWFDPNHPEFKALAVAEKEAKDARRGLWGEDDLEEKSPWTGKTSSTPAASNRDNPSSASRELATDDGRPASKRSLPQGFAVKFKKPAGDWVLTAVRIHGSRYGHPAPPREDFHVTLCDTEFKSLTDFPFPYSRFRNRGNPQWVTLKVKPTELPDEFIICVDFNAEATKGVYVTHDGEGSALVGKANQPAGTFNAGDWFIRAVIEPRK